MLRRIKKTAVKNLIHNFYGLVEKKFVCLFLSASKNNRQLSHMMRHLQIIFAFSM